jgi:hypothetical protein
MKTQHSIRRVLLLAFVFIQFGAPAKAQNTNSHGHWVATRVALSRELPTASGEFCPDPATLDQAVADFRTMTDAADFRSLRNCVKVMRPCA